MTEPAFSARLLKGDAEPDPAEVPRRWSYGVIGMFIVSMFIAYHTVILLTWNTPSNGFAKRMHSQIIKSTYARRYFTATSNTQSWSMFAPNPNRTNVFIRVLIEDAEGEWWDMGHDIWKVDRFPYWFYDRMGKVNRRIDGKKGYQKAYAAWMCRQWGLSHDGVLPQRVKFVKRWTRVPKPDTLIKKGMASGGLLGGGTFGYEPWKLKSQQKEQNVIKCAQTVHAQLDNEMRARHDLPLLDDDGFKSLKIRTWYDRQVAEERKAKREAEREASGVPSPTMKSAQFERNSVTGPAPTKNRPAGSGSQATGKSTGGGAKGSPKPVLEPTVGAAPAKG